jgi:hypothetical protein
VPADTATVIFGHHVRPITRPGTAPAEVTEFAARDNWGAVDEAIDALVGALGLSRTGAARLLVIVSDGKFRPDPRRDAQTRIDRLRAAGCGVLWLAPDTEDTRPLDGVTVHVMADPTAPRRPLAAPLQPPCTPPASPAGAGAGPGPPSTRTPPRRCRSWRFGRTAPRYCR